MQQSWLLEVEAIPAKTRGKLKTYFTCMPQNSYTFSSKLINDSVMYYSTVLMYVEHMYARIMLPDNVPTYNTCICVYTHTSHDTGTCVCDHKIPTAGPWHQSQRLGTSSLLPGSGMLEHYLMPVLGLCAQSQLSTVCTSLKRVVAKVCTDMHTNLRYM